MQGDFVKFILQSMFFGARIHLLRILQLGKGGVVVPSEALVLELLKSGDWGADAPVVAAFLRSPYEALLEEALERLSRDALYMSHVHGVGHIERTMLHGAMCAWAEALGEEDTRLLLTMCAYHDTGRNCDYLDGAHGARSAARLQGLTGLAGEELRIARAGVEAHSLGDDRMPAILERYAPQDRARAERLARLLKDSDGLDRVRIHDLNPDYLRFPSSRLRAGFAQALFDRYVPAEEARGGSPAAGGWDLPTIQRVKAFAATCFDMGKSCGETLLEALDELAGTAFAPALGPGLPKDGELCGMLTGGTLWLASAFRAAGKSEGEIDGLLKRFRERFGRQYGSELCADIRPAMGCGGFAVDGILFALEFYNQNTEETGVVLT